VALCRACGTYSVDRLLTDPPYDSASMFDDTWRTQVQMGHAGGILRLATPHDRAAQRRLLDVGSSTGAMIQVATGQGYECMGVELEPKLVEIARRYVDAPILDAPVETAALPPNYFTLVTMSHVVEHVYDPQAALESVYRAVAPGGIVYIEVPNAHSGAARWLYRRRWNGLIGRGHYWLWSQQSLENLCRPMGFDLVTAQTWNAPVYSSGLRKWAKQAIYWGLDRTAEGDNLAVVLRKTGAAA
jgi:SAM-dependent methyltransferase